MIKYLGKFQFQIGAIKSFKHLVATRRGDEFQFQIGAIKRPVENA